MDSTRTKLQAVAMLQESMLALLDALSIYKASVNDATNDEARALHEVKQCLHGNHKSMAEFLRRLGERP